MKYVRLKWNHTNPDEPVWLFSELDDRGKEVRKIECFRYADNSAGRKKLAEDCYNRVLGRVTGKDLFLDDGGDSTDEPSTLLSS